MCAPLCVDVNIITYVKNVSRINADIKIKIKYVIKYVKMLTGTYHYVTIIKKHSYMQVTMLLYTRYII